MPTATETRRARLEMLIAQHGSIANLNTALGYDRTEAKLSRIRNAIVRTDRPGKVYQMGGTKAREIEAKLNLPAGWMDTPTDLANTGPAAIGTRRVPLISFVQAGTWTEVTDSHAPGDADTYLLTDLDLSDSAFALVVRGQSMLPDFREGDRIIIDPEIRPQPGDYVVAKRLDEEEATFKKYRLRGYNDAGQEVIELLPLNPDFAPLRSDVTPFRIVGTMIEHRRYRTKK